MKIINISLLVILMLIGFVAGGKLKFVAFKGPHFGFAGVKVRTPKLLGLKKHGFGHGLGHGLGGGHLHAGGFHSSGYEHHEYHHESHHSSGGGFGGGAWFGK